MRRVTFWLRIIRRLILKTVGSIKGWRAVTRLSRHFESSKSRVLIYGRLAAHHTFTGPVVRELDRLGCQALILTSDQGHSLLAGSEASAKCHVLPPGFELFIRFVSAPLPGK